MAIHASEKGPPDERIFLALGKLVYAFAQLEEGLTVSLLATLGSSDEAGVIISGLSLPQALDRFSILYAPVGSSEPSIDVRELCNRVSNMNEERNLHIHSIWGFWDSGQPMRLRRRLKRHQGLTFSMETVDPARVLELVRELEVATTTVYELHRRYFEYAAGRRREELAGLYPAS